MSFENKVPLYLIQTLRSLRVKHGMIDSEVSKQLGISTNKYKDWENDSSNIPYSYILKLEEIFQIPAKYIFFGNNTTLGNNNKKIGIAQLQIYNYRGEQHKKMNNITIKHINEVLINDVLAADIYMDDKLILVKNTLLTVRLIALLKKKNVRSLCTTGKNSSHNDNNSWDYEKSFLYSKKEMDQIRNEKSSCIKLFLKCLVQVGSPSRYGNMLSTSEEMQFIIELFLRVLDKYNFVDKLYKLKDWDYYSFIHSFDVFIIGSLFARKKEIRNLESKVLGYLLHDIGKLHIPQELLKRTRKLNREEFDIMKTHTTEGYMILNSMGLNHIAHFSKSHHERIDGSGYPEQLNNQDLMQELKILQLVDVYSTLTLKHPYRKALSPSRALDILYSDAHRFDQNLLEDFVGYLKISPTNTTVLLSDNN